MNLDNRIKSFELLGDLLRRFHENSCDREILPLVMAARFAYAQNPWFTPEHIRLALNSLGELLKSENLSAWLSKYHQKLAEPVTQKTIGVVLAGNIPAVGFHDFLCVLISGNKLKAKLSSSDALLLPAMAEILTGYFPEWKEQISFTNGMLEHFDAIIATGSDNTSRYFEYYFGKYQHIIRKTRNSVAVISGEENENVMQNMANDIMQYFGMGCRSISKLYVPKGYDFLLLTKALGKFEYYCNHNKYRNNYDYSKSIFLVNRIPFIDTGYLLFKEDPSIKSRIAVLHYQYYSNITNILDDLNTKMDSIQCVVCNSSFPLPCVMPGKAQQPALWEYADNVDTLDFLLS
ncbi:MAG: acyl-CoA reductase [Bacteroidota bacterium]